MRIHAARGARPRSNGSRSISWKSSSLGSPMARWSVYIVRCRNGALYTGIATDVRRRIAEHAQSNGKGAKCLRGKGPLLLVFVKVIGTRSSALRVESQLKMLPKTQKEKLVWQFRRSAGCRPQSRPSRREGQDPGPLEVTLCRGSSSWPPLDDGKQKVKRP